MLYATQSPYCEIGGHIKLTNNLTNSDNVSIQETINENGIVILISHMGSGAQRSLTFNVTYIFGMWWVSTNKISSCSLHGLIWPLPGVSFVQLKLRLLSEIDIHLKAVLFSMQLFMRQGVAEASSGGIFNAGHREE